MYNILITEDISPAGLALLDEAPDVKYDLIKLPGRDKLREIIGEYDAVITRSGTLLDADLLEASGRLKMIASGDVGIDNIDVQSATRRGILVMNAPGANTLAVAELTMALMLGLCRDLPCANDSVKRGEWTRSKFVGAELNGKTLGVIGLGRVGSRVATRSQAFGMTVMAWDPYIAEEAAGRIHVQLAGELDELLARADFITLHTPLTDETRGIIGAAQFAKMKDGVRLINCARGGLCDEQALYDGLASGKIAGAALDMYSVEAPRTELFQKLIALDNVLVTPHIGANTVEAQRDVALQVVQQVLDALRGESFRNVVNLPFAEGVDYRLLAPYMTLAEKIGSLHSQLIQGRIERVEVEFRGDDIESHARPLTVALLKGMLTSILGDAVNYVNAPGLAEERGMLVSQTRHSAAEGYSQVILCRVISTKETRLIGGALLLRTQPRIVLLDDFRIDALPSGWALVMTSQDRPGVMGKVGTLLGNHGINIARWQTGREAPGRKQLSFINIDMPASDPVLAELRALPQVISLRQVTM